MRACKVPLRNTRFAPSPLQFLEALHPLQFGFCEVGCPWFLSYRNITVSMMTSPLPSPTPPPDCSARIQFHELEQWMASPPHSNCRSIWSNSSRTQGPRSPTPAPASTRPTPRSGDVGRRWPLLMANRSPARSSPLATPHAQTVFGPIDMIRLGLGLPGHQSIHPLDADLQLPERPLYELQRRRQGCGPGPSAKHARILDSTGLTSISSLDRF